MKDFKHRLIKVMKNPEKVFVVLLRMSKGLISDENFVKIAYFILLGRKLNLKNPIYYNEKIQWLKLYDRKDNYQSFVDKVSAKKIIGNIIGEEYIIPTLGVWKSFDDIDFDSLPNRFVLKTSHDSGTVIVCTDKNKFNKIKAKKKINRALQSNFFWVWREWPYKNIEPQIIVEEYLSEDNIGNLKDYKFFCFDGVPKAMYIASDRQTSTKFDFFDIEFNHLPFVNGYENSNLRIVKPLGFEKMIELSKLISRNFIHVRVDFYSINGKIYFGELTFYHWSGLVPFYPEEWDKVFGDWIQLPSSKYEN